MTDSMFHTACNTAPPNATGERHKSAWLEEARALVDEERTQVFK